MEIYVQLYLSEFRSVCVNYKYEFMREIASMITESPGSQQQSLMRKNNVKICMGFYHEFNKISGVQTSQGFPSRINFYVTDQGGSKQNYLYSAVFTETIYDLLHLYCGANFN